MLIMTIKRNRVRERERDVVYIIIKVPTGKY